MGDTWLRLEPGQTVKKYTIIDSDGVKFKRVENERCMLCYKTETTLYGRYGTYNEFGSFIGVCEKCLKKLNKL